MPSNYRNNKISAISNDKKTKSKDPRPWLAEEFWKMKATHLKIANFEKHCFRSLDLGHSWATMPTL